MKLRGIFILLLSLNVGFCATLACAQERVKLQTLEEFDSNGKPVPLTKATVELLSYIEKTLPIHFQIQRVPWKRAMSNALKEDLVLMGMSINKERLDKYLFSDAINANGNWLVTRCDSRFPFNNIQDLKGKLIGIVAATSAGEAFDGQVGKLFLVENDIGAGISRLQKLMAKRMDALVWHDNVDAPLKLENGINLSYGQRVLSSPTGDAKPFCVLPKPISIVTNHFAMRISPSNRQLLDRINQAMAKGRKEGAIPPAVATILN
jgi:ABC-type amino acid transport substrate-binding protein